MKNLMNVLSLICFSGRIQIVKKNVFCCYQNDFTASCLEDFSPTRPPFEIGSNRTMVPIEFKVTHKSTCV